MYSESEDDRLNDYLSEQAMIEKVSVFLSEATIDVPTDRDMLKSSFHKHENSILEVVEDVMENEKNELNLNEGKAFLLKNLFKIIISFVIKIELLLKVLIVSK